MKIDVKAFGIARDILGTSSFSMIIEANTSVEHLMQQLKIDFPAFAELTSLAIAINESYAESAQIIKADDEIVIIPPVAGG